MIEPGQVFGYIRVLECRGPRLVNGRRRQMLFVEHTCCGTKRETIGTELTYARRHDRCLDCQLREDGGRSAGHEGAVEPCGLDGDDALRALGAARLDGVCGTPRALYRGEAA